MAVMLAYFKVPLTWWQILRKTFTSAFYEDNCLGLSAQLAYYFFFALFPALLVLLAVASFFPYHTLVDEMVKTLGGFVPPEMLDIITGQLAKISSTTQGGILTIGVLTALWSTSSAMTAIISTLNAAYHIEEGRPWWKVRITAILLTLGVAVFILIAFALILIGPTVAEHIANRLYLGPVFEWSWKIAQWPVAFLLASAGVAIVYYFAPDAEQDWVWLTPGSLVATLLWLGASLGFKYYVANLSSYTASYGVVGTVMVLLLWFYISGLVLLLGAEMNAEIEHASPYGKEAGEKVAGQKRKIGHAAMRAWTEKRKQHGEKPPSAEEVKALTGPPPPDKQPGNRPPSPAPSPRPAVAVNTNSGGALNYLIGTAVIVAQAFWALRSVGARPRRERQ
jgi:membrane protein